ncbi:MAG: single-stranded-DNA-specific exonuclease RecJ [bacterium]|nr:single-stranded-DNA-specific exonuclease RecJ [bacterium]
MEKHWSVADPAPQEYHDAFPEVHPALVQLLYNRGLKTQKEVDEFLQPDYSQNVHDPFLFRQMDTAVTRVLRALDQKERIVVHGDYDADGVCGASVLVSGLRIINPDADIETYLPHREVEGYGMNIESVEQFAKSGTKLIITADCGTTNVKEIKRARELGMEVIVTDHHVPHGDLPETTALLNPWVEGETYPFQPLCGTGVAFKLVQALFRRAKIGEKYEKWLLDLVAIGTIADYVPLIGENRTLAKYGLIVLQKTRRVGLQAMFQIINLQPENIDTQAVAFKIIPRINAAGRVDHANGAYQMLVTGIQEEAAEFARNLHQLNLERQKITERITQSALEQIGEVTPDQPLLLAEGEDWPAGLVGLVASRIMDKYYRPTVIVGRRQGLIIGSGRSLPEFHITEALQSMSDLFTDFGGHRQACGFTLTAKATVDELRQRLIEAAKKSLDGLDLKPRLHIDSEITFDQIDWKLVETLEDFEPYGEGNPQPKWLTKNIEVLTWDVVGKNGKHLRLSGRDDSGVSRRFICFGFGEWAEKLQAGKKIDAVYEIGINEWNGTRELQLKLVDILQSHD